ncbi:Crp/Fnr family transcriptional regulator [Kitasatospora brasiliensis]|uniref:Crp/Fnr family transcriptional regulator n=1 Tax=Kitasatospora brasiliensis TaxID=3058040 RepID=UPI00292D5DF8|nr:cyclic nucleotide-binding domain-containing protein [Kitasatospora sp. K002]
MTDHVSRTPAPLGRTLRHLMGEPVWTGMLAEAYERRHSIGATLLRQGEPGTHVLALLAGVAKVSRQERNGDVRLLAFRGPGELLGEVAVLDDGVRSASVQAISDCTVAVLAKAAFLRFVAERDLFPVMVRYAMGRLRESDLARTGGDVVPRLAAALVALADLSAGAGVATAGGRRIELALTRDELAQHLGVSRNTVTAALAALAAHRVDAGRKSIAVGDLAALRRAAAALHG